MRLFVNGILALGLVTSSTASAGCLRDFSPSTPDEVALVQVENDWCEAAIQRDGAALSRIFADDISWAEDVGYRDKQGVLDRYLIEVREHSMELRDVRIRVIGDVGIVQSHVHVRKTVAGKTIENVHPSTDVFIRRDGRWQLLAE